MSHREESLKAWAIKQVLNINHPSQKSVWSMVSGDASFRRYFRLQQAGKSFIAVDSPPTKEDNQSFISIAKQWHQVGIAVPEILALDETCGFMLLEDLGDGLFSMVLNQTCDAKQRFEYYAQAIDALVHLQKNAPTHLPAYTQAKLLEEMQLFTHWLCESYLAIDLNSELQAQFEQLFKLLIDSACQQIQVPVHRDYHSRNLMLSDGKLRIIDFQDALIGPISYDLVSLLRDCYVRWDEAETQAQLEYYYQQAVQMGFELPEKRLFTQQFDFMGLQRHLKAAGIFARLHLRDGKSGYLQDIPNTCRYLQEVSRQYEQTAWLSSWLEHTLMPALKNKEMVLA